MKESRTLEFKETVNNSFLKTVSAFSNYEGGEIKFGVTDDGRTVGIENAETVLLDLENKVNDSITPPPDYTLACDDADVITLAVKPGLHPPYFYKGKAYRRNDTATVEVDRTELNRLILSGEHLLFEELPSKQQNLTFEDIEQKLKEKLSVEKLSRDVLKTLGLFRDGAGFNQAALLFSEQNSFPGIDAVKFGPSIDIIEDRETIENCSVLRQYDQAVRLFTKNYTYEKIEGIQRTVKARIPEKAFREALANAIVHRTWDVNVRIRIAMHPDRLEVISPGGLPFGVSETEYLNGQVSLLRNPTIGMVFFRLGLIEMFGTGIQRIKDAYTGTARKPSFVIYENSIKVTLPVTDISLHLSTDESALLALLQNDTTYTAAEIARMAAISKDKTLRLLKKLTDKQMIEISGKGRGTRYGKSN